MGGRKIWPWGFVFVACVLRNLGYAADRQPPKGWQPMQSFPDGRVVHQNNVYVQKRVPLEHFDRVVVKQRVKVYRPPAMYFHQ